MAKASHIMYLRRIYDLAWWGDICLDAGKRETSVTVAACIQKRRLNIFESYDVYPLSQGR